MDVFGRPPQQRPESFPKSETTAVAKAHGLVAGAEQKWKNHPFDGQIARFAAPAGEYDFVRPGAKQGCNLSTCNGNCLAGGSAEGVGTRWVAEIVAQIRQHCVYDVGIDWRCRVVVEVDGMVHQDPFSAAHRLA